MYGDQLRRGVKERRNRNPQDGIHPDVLAWKVRATKTGGGFISYNTLIAVNRFYRSLKQSGFYEKMKGVCCFVPDNLIACTTPLIVGTGVDPWTNAGFISSDLSIEGLKGNTAKYLKTGLRTNVMYASTGEGGVTAYNTYNSAYSGCDIGSAVDSPAHFFTLYFCLDGTTTYWDCHSQVVPGRVSGANFMNRGYISANRIGNWHGIFKANSTTPHQVIAQATDGVDGVLSSLDAYVFGRNVNNAVASPGDLCFSFVAFHTGLVLDESEHFYGLVQRLRQELGGGWK